MAELAVVAPDGGTVEVAPASTLACHRPLALGHTQAELGFFFGQPIERFDLEYRFEPTVLAALPYARLVTASCAVISLDGFLVEASYTGNHVLEKSGRFLGQKMTVDLGGQRHQVPFLLFRDHSDPLPVEGGCLLPFDYWHVNYHHWVVECLPRLRWALELPELAGCRIVVPDPMAPFQREALDLVGIPPERRLPFAGDDWRVERLYFPSVGNFSPGQLVWVRDRCLAGLGTGDPEAPRGRYYISRADAAGRRVANEAQVVATLEPLGFEVLQLTGVPFSRQVALFSQAEIVVGPHGSGLTNAIFGPEDVTWVELMPDDEVNHCFWLLANSRGQRYTFVVGRRVSEQRDFLVPVDRLRRVMDGLLAEVSDGRQSTG